MYHCSQAESSLRGGMMGISVETERSALMLLQSSRSVFLTLRENVFDIVTWEENNASFVWCIQDSVSCPIIMSLKNASLDNLS